MTHLHIRSIFWLGVAACLVPQLTHGQEVVQKGDTAEELNEWTELEQEIISAPVDSDKKGKKSRALKQAEKLNAFAKKNKKSVRRSEARRLEVMALLQAQSEDDSETRDKLAKVAREIVTDQTISESERAIVDGTMRIEDVFRKATGEKEVLDRFEDVGLSMIKDYPFQPQGYETLLTVALRANDSKANRLARIIDVESAPSYVREEAKSILLRYSYLGKSLSEVAPELAEALQKLPSSKGGAVIYFSSAADTARLVNENKGSGKDWFYIAVDELISTALPGQRVDLETSRARKLLGDLRLNSTEGCLITDKQGVVKHVSFRRFINDLSSN